MAATFTGTKIVETGRSAGPAYRAKLGTVRTSCSIHLAF
jgi:hypothetical protein